MGQDLGRYPFDCRLKLYVYQYIMQKDKNTLGKYILYFPNYEEIVVLQGSMGHSMFSVVYISLFLQVRPGVHINPLNTIPLKISRLLGSS